MTENMNYISFNKCSCRNLSKASIFIILTILLSVYARQDNGEQRVLVISLDGFGKDYLQKYSLENFKKLYHTGSHVERFRNQFPTMTLPNHFSVATGLYIEEHGVIGNYIYDPTLDTFLNSSMPKFFEQKEDVSPIWTINENNGGVSACLMWPGCGLNYQNVTETYYLPFHPSYSLDSLTNAALTLLYPKDTFSLSSVASSPLESVKHLNFDKSDVAANLVMLYYEEPDGVGHNYGPDSEQMETILQEIDASIGRLMDEVSSKQLPLDVIILSDHGMMNIQTTNIMQLDSIIDPESYYHSGNSPLLHIHPQAGETLQVFKHLMAGSQKMNFSVVIKADLPASLHYKDNVRVGPILLQADPGFAFDDIPREASTPDNDVANYTFGKHGWSQSLVPAMSPILVAVGPSFRANFQISEASNVDVFPLLCELLSLQSPKTNGSLDTLQLILNAPPIYNNFRSALLALVLAVGGVSLVCTAFYCKMNPQQHKHMRLRTDPMSLIDDSPYRRTNSLPMMRPSSIMMSEDELDEEEKLLAANETWEV